MKIPQPFLPVTVESKKLHHTVRVVGREYTFGPDGMITSIKSEGIELLAAPMRLVCIEDGEPAVFDRDYENNESESFIQRRSDSEAVICGAMQTDRFLINTCQKIGYDGNIDIDFKLLTRGYTVPQNLGLEPIIPQSYRLDRLWLEVPLKKEICTLFHQSPVSEIKLADGTVLPKNSMSSSGAIPGSAAFPFKTLFWLGNEERGLGWYAENDRNWQPEEPDKAIEIVVQEDCVILRIHLLDSHPKSWKGDLMKGTGFLPVEFFFGFQATPVKPFPKQPYIHNAFHIDCGIKIQGNYRDFLDKDNRFDLLKERGVTTLVLHEKWNKSQNWFELSECTEKQLKYICDECHKRGIKVLPYFGYEMSSLSEIWSSQKNELAHLGPTGSFQSGWWRVPFQRDYICCYASDYAEYFLAGIEKIMDTCHIDGVYLDGTAKLKCCYNEAHGCGWRDEDGQLHGTYPVRATRDMFRRLYDIVSSRGGEINVHCVSQMNFTVLPYIHQTWYGENLQAELLKGNSADVNLDYFRAEYIGRNMGVPVEFIVYAKEGVWTFENAMSTCILHGILPRPNDIGHPLEMMSKVWKIFDAFPVEKSQWCPYWNNGAETSHEKVKVSYYSFTTLRGEKQLLAFVSNISNQKAENVEIKLREPVTRALEVTTGQEIGLQFDLNGYDYKILFVE
ncbi:MAG: hypothetical protein IJ030_04200 [Oscillospiraceae bacterium]|nr:hypothetical protein [Oscillospiraceae bacterium]